MAIKNNKKIPLMCRIFGHKAPKYGNQPAYGRVRPGTIDGVGREHANVIARCDRCDTEYVIIKIHLPKKEI